MQWTDVLGQDKAKETLQQMVINERMPHALLLLGNEGCGNLALALAHARYVLCQQKTTEKACGICPDCIKMNKYIHPDVHFSYPTVGTNVTSDKYLKLWRTALLENPYLNVNQWLQSIEGGNKRGNINKEECNQIIKKLNLKIYEGSHKILIMWLPEYLGKEGNRLLKLIEEPPAQTLFILVAENQELILNTILSRCQLITIPPLSGKVISQGLQDKFNLNAEKSDSIAYLADGNFNEALYIAQHAESDHATLFVEWLRKCYKGNGVDLVKYATELAKFSREEQKYFLKYALHFLRELMVLITTGDTNLKLREATLQTAKKLTAVVDLMKLRQIAALLTSISYYIERNANPKILFLDTSIKIHQLLRK